MPNDITTLAIEIQSQEAERNLRTFNELLSLSSQTAQKMEKVSIEIDVTGALTQLNALRENYIACAKAAESMTFDMPQVASPEVDTTALDELKAFFAQSLEASKELRAEMANFNDELEKLEAGNIKVASSYGGAESGARMAAVANSEYARVFREVVAAQKEMEKAVAKADEAMKATVAAGGADMGVPSSSPSSCRWSRSSKKSDGACRGNRTSPAKGKVDADPSQYRVVL